MRRLLYGLAAAALALAPTGATRRVATSRRRTRTSCSPPKKCSSPGTPSSRSRASRSSPSSKGMPSTSAWSSPRPPSPNFHEMPRDFFKHLAVYSILKKRESPTPNCLPQPMLNGRRRRWRSTTRCVQHGLHFRPQDCAAADSGFGGGHGRLPGLQDY